MHSGLPARRPRRVVADQHEFDESDSPPIIGPEDGGILQERQRLTVGHPASGAAQALSPNPAATVQVAEWTRGCMLQGGQVAITMTSALDPGCLRRNRFYGTDERSNNGNGGETDSHRWLPDWGVATLMSNGRSLCKLLKIRGLLRRHPQKSWPGRTTHGPTSDIQFLERLLIRRIS